MSNIVETDVLIVGAGPAGAMASLLLGGLGVQNMMINKYKSTSPGPRSHITNQRTMEIMRDVGLEEAAKAIASPQSYMGEHVYATSLAGEEFGRIRSWSTHPASKAEHDMASPASYCDLPQLYFEPLLVNAASQRGSDVRFQTEYLSHTQDDQGVTATLLDRISGQEYQVRAKYLIGADGARSKVAQDAELPFGGQMAVGDSGSINIEFSADLTPLVDHRRGDMYWLLQPGTGVRGNGVGVLRMVRPWSKWVAVWGYELAKGAPKLDEAEAKRIVQRLIGTDSIPVTIEAMSTWTINRQFATRNTQGRVFCMGDAVHRHTPQGGLGLNTSVQDAYNLCWKISMVLKGTADPALLASYDAERSPVAQQIVEYAYGCGVNFDKMLRALELPKSPSEDDMAKCLAALREPTPAAAARRAAFRQAMDATIAGFGGGYGVEMNQRYESGAVAADGSADPGFERDRNRYYQASTRPGAHLPHAWLTADQRRVSTLDLCGKGQFTVLTGLSGAARVEAAAKASEALGIANRVHVIGHGQANQDANGDFARLPGIEESGA
jgi:2,4-dichlorophenol 6-monooxygenase